MSKFFFALVLVTIVFIHCCDADKEKTKGRRTANKHTSNPQHTRDNPVEGF